MEERLKSAGLWTTELKRSINELLLEFSCKVGREPASHPQINTNVPEQYKQTSVSLDILFVEGVPIMHALDKCIGWSEISMLRSRNHQEQVSTFARIWLYRHGIPKKIHADTE